MFELEPRLLVTENKSLPEILEEFPYGPEVWDGVVAAPPERPHELPVYRNKAFPELVTCLHRDLDTHAKLFNHAARLFAHRPCLGHRPYDYRSNKSKNCYHSLTYAEVNQRKRNLGSGLLRALQASRLDRLLESHQKILRHESSAPTFNSGRHSFILSIFSANRVEWMLTDLACSAYSITNTALYDTLGDGVTQYILETTELPVVVCSHDKIEALLDMKPRLANLVLIVSMDPMRFVDQAVVARGKRLGVQVLDIHQVEVLGASARMREIPPSPNTLYTISFTLGTTGANPKGAKLTHRNIALAVAFFVSTKRQVPDGRALIYLPLTHIFERGTLAFAISTGYHLGFPHLSFGEKQDAFASLVEDCRVFKPHYFSIVPRLLTKFESAVKSHLAESNERVILQEVIANKMSAQAAADGADGKSDALDTYGPYHHLRKMFGFDNLVWTQTASAPVNPNTLKYLKAALNIGVSQLYGLTESTGAYTRSPDYEHIPGSCGPTGISCEVKLVSRPEMGYLVENHEGELLIRGAEIFAGYFKNDAETKKVYDTATGWFATGDISRIDPVTGRIYIIDRVKNFFKLQQGEYISPEKVENVYLSLNPVIQQLYVHGDSLRAWLVGVVGITHEAGCTFLKKKPSQLSPEEMVEEINQLPNKRRFLHAINTTTRAHLNGIERLHNIHIEINPLRLDRDVVTPTLKLKRAVAARFFKDVFSRLYDEESSLLTRSSL